MDKPLVSFVIASYNQESFIREAIEGAFSQTYSPLEIIISDDRSADRTFEIIRQMAAAYGGPHSVRVNQNEKNLGIGAHVNRLMELSKGELVVLAAGDDISLPERTDTVVRAWNDSGRRAASLSSKSLVIDRDGRPLGKATDRDLAETQGKWTHQQGTIADFLRRRRPVAVGCSHAISRTLFTAFGPLPETATYEDVALSFRTVLAGGVFTFIDAPLVKYRRHEHNITFDLDRVHLRTARSFAEIQQKRCIELERWITAYKGFSADVERAKQQGMVSANNYPAVRRQLQRERRRLELKRGLLVNGGLKRWIIFFKLYSSTVRPRELLTQLPHLLPRPLYRAGLRGLNGS